jgi:acetyl-CoA carboxylase biotin carboxyl carrier protein
MSEIKAILRESVIVAPRVGVWVPGVMPGDGLAAGRVLGSLFVLNRRFDVLCPRKAKGEVASVIGKGPVEYGQQLIEVGSRTSTAADGLEETDGPAGSVTGDYEVKTPIDGIFYRRPTPDSAPYVEEGDIIELGATLGLVEVMKTFNPIRYDASAAPERAKIVEIVPEDMSEVAAGSVLYVVQAL